MSGQRTPGKPGRSDSDSRRFEGALQSWNDERGFGFVLPDQGGEPIFVHIKAITNLDGRPAPAQRLSFEIEIGPQGKKRAKNVLPIRATRPIRLRQPAAASWGAATLFAVPAFMLLYGGVALFWRPPATIAWVYLGMSLLTFVAYARDKAAARNGTWRTSEQTLHLLSIACGWPGALMAQRLLGHKSTKAAFRSVFWGTVLINVLGFIGLCSPIGRELLRT